MSARATHCETCGQPLPTDQLRTRMINALIAAGYSHQEVATAIGVSRQRMHQIVGRTAVSSARVAERRAAIAAEPNVPLAEMARRFGVSVQTIALDRRKAGLTHRALMQGAFDAVDFAAETDDQIAARLGVALGTVRQHRYRRGIQRTRGPRASAAVNGHANKQEAR